MNRRWSNGATSMFRSLLALVCLVFAAHAEYRVDFEGDGETKSSYASGTVALSGINWNLTDVLIGTSVSDWKNGARSARLRGHGSSSMTMLGDKAGGLGTLSFKYCRYGSDSQVDWRVEYSTDAGLNWTPIGSDFIAPGDDTVQTFSEAVDVQGNVRIRIKRATESGTSDRRLNIDDILLNDYGAIGVPLVDTAVVTDITPTTATAGGEVVSENGAAVTARGVVYNTAGAPSTDDTTVPAAGGGLGAFTVALETLLPGQIYFVRAYAQNAQGVGYGAERSFQSAGFAHAPVLQPITQRFNDGFIVEWTAVEGAVAYQLDVAIDRRFSPGGVVTQFRETMGNAGGTTSIADHDTAAGFDHSGSYVYGDGGAANPGDVRATLVSSGYTDAAGNEASGGANIWLTSTAGDRGFSIGGIDTRSHADLRLSFGYRKESTSANAAFVVEWSPDAGDHWYALTVTGLPAVDAGTGWYWIEDLELPTAAENREALSLRWIKSGTVGMRIDDVLLRGDSGAASLHPRYDGVAVHGTSLRVNRLSPGDYHVRVRAVGAEDCFSAYSNVESAQVSGGMLLLLQ